MPDRPRLRIPHRPLRRSADAVQLGLGPGALVLAGLGPGELELLDRLDGTRTVAELRALALAGGAGAGAVDSLLRLLRSHGLLADPTLERLPRASPLVLVGGPDHLTRVLARSLRELGLGRVDCGDWAVDQLELALRAAPADVSPPALVVLAADGGHDPQASTPWLRHGIAHLPVLVDPTTAVLGPLVVAPVAAGAGCSRCVELHRCDGDTGRPAVLAQTVGSRVHSAAARVPAGPAPIPPVLLGVTASVTAMVVAAYLSGQVLPAGVTVELSLPWPRVDHRRWARHPRCAAGVHEAGRARGTMTG